MNKIAWTLVGLAFCLLFIAIDLVHFAFAIGIGIFLLWFLNEEDWRQIEEAKGTTPDKGEVVGLAKNLGKKFGEAFFSHPAEKYTTKDLGLRVSKGSRRVLESGKKVFRTK